MIDPNAEPQASGGIAGAMPQGGEVDPRRPQGQIGGDLLKALAAQKLLKEKQMAENQLAMSQEADPQTVVAKNEAELSQRSLGEVSKGVSDVLTKKNADKQKNMQRMASGKNMQRMAQGQPRRGRPPQGAPQGLANARMAQAAAQQGGPTRMAQGGIVGFAEGQTVDAEGQTVDAKIAAIKNSTTMSEEQKAAAIKQLYVAEAQGQAKGLGGFRNFVNQNLNPAQLIGDGLGGINYLIGGGADLLASGANLVNMPSVGAGLAEFADENYASGKKYIDKGMFANTFLEGPDREVATTAAPVTTAPEGPAFEQTGRGTPPVVPPVALESEGESYDDRRSRFARAGAKGGISGFGEAMTEIETAEREQELEENKVRLQAEYQESIVDARSYNDAIQNLLKYNQELNTLIAQDPLVVQAKSNLSEALSARGGKGKNVDKARKVYDDAMKKAMIDIGSSVSGGSLLSNIAALEAAVKSFRTGKGTTKSANVTASLEAIK